MTLDEYLGTIGDVIAEQRYEEAVQIAKWHSREIERGMRGLPTNLPSPALDALRNSLREEQGQQGQPQ